MCFAVGKLPASQASSEVVSAFRRDEKERTRKLLSNSLSICTQSKVFFFNFKWVVVICMTRYNHDMNKYFIPRCMLLLFKQPFSGEKLISFYAIIPYQRINHLLHDQQNHWSSFPRFFTCSYSNWIPDLRPCIGKLL